MLPQVVFSELGLSHSNKHDHHETERLTNGNRNHESENRETVRRDPQQIYRTGIRNFATALFETSFENLRSFSGVEIFSEEMKATRVQGIDR